ncbi:MAG: signal peptidase I [Gammaproteobacteria bacterium]|nr:MAG: signal peptidase I [Gammaproteobacteria bacterium]
MDFDFAAFLVLATVICGAIWAVDAFYFSRFRDGEKKQPIIVEYARSFFPVFLIVLLLRSFLVEPFKIPSGSMMPTLLSGDFILVSKFSYGIRLPVLNAKIIDVGEPRRGDVMVFRFPEDPSTNFIKRVIGLPGDKVAYFNKILYINDTPMEQKLLGTYFGIGDAARMNGASHRLEKLENVEHQILIRDRVTPQGFEFTVPEGEFFVLGDNRDNSNDSRYWGTVPEANLVGRAFMIWMNWNSADTSVTWSRIGTVIN